MPARAATASMLVEPYPSAKNNSVAASRIRSRSSRAAARGGRPVRLAAAAALRGMFTIGAGKRNRAGDKLARPRKANAARNRIGAPENNHMPGDNTLAAARSRPADAHKREAGHNKVALHKRAAVHIHT